MLTRSFDWLFRNRSTGAITIAQFPNVPLAVFLVAAGVRWLFHPTGALGTVVAIAAAAGLIVWAVLEVARGVNPWRRILGGTVLGFVILSRLLA